MDGIGVTAGEHVHRQRVNKVGGIEQWLWQTYGQGVMDAKRANPQRKLRFIFRQHQANLGRITHAFREFDGPFNTGHKYARAVNTGAVFDGVTPIQVADKLNGLATLTLKGVASLRTFRARGQKELLATLTDMEVVALLACYYADKIHGAAALAVFRDAPGHTAYHRRAVRHLKNAVAKWEVYTELATGHYHPQLLSRTHHLDWEKLLDDVKQGVETVRGQEP